MLRAEDLKNIWSPWIQNTTAGSELQTLGPKPYINPYKLLHIHVIALVHMKGIDDDLDFQLEQMIAEEVGHILHV